MPVTVRRHRTLFYVFVGEVRVGFGHVRENDAWIAAEQYA